MDMTKFGYREGYNDENRDVGKDAVVIDGKSFLVSTVDLGIDHSHGRGLPLYYETMVFPEGDFTDMYMNRYTTRDEALQGHTELVNDLKSGKYTINDGYFELI